jgi:hypothetical protein
MSICFVDTETTGLDPDGHEIWEVGLITPDGDEHEWQLPVDLSRADPIALNIGRFHERRWEEPEPGPIDVISRDGRCLQTPLVRFARRFVNLSRGHHLAGAVVSFDAERLWKLLRANGQCPMWHYHLIDVEALAAGWLMGRGQLVPEMRLEADPSARELLEGIGIATPPWDSNVLSCAVGVDPDQFDRHTALGDARWAKAVYEAVMG